MPASKTTKALLKRSDQALDAFHSFYASSSNWGEQRWNETLFPRLSQPTRYCALLNLYAPDTNVDVLLRDAEAPPGKLDRIVLPGSAVSNNSGEAQLSCFQSRLEPSSQNSFSFPPPKRADSENPEQRLLTHWNMDAASVLAASMLQVRPGDSVLDLCAAPGGKSVTIAQLLWPELHAGHDGRNPSLARKSCLHSNEKDAARNKRLVANLKSYLPPQLFLDGSVKVTNIDGSDKRVASMLPLGEEGYDKVLVDAPCSSERHIIHAHVKAKMAGQVAEEMANWKSSHTVSLAKIQAGLLMTALRAVKLGGRVVYATCSISFEENDGVIGRTLEAVKRERKKAANGEGRGWDIKIFAADNLAEGLDQMTESTKYGHIALPDHPTGGGWGALYFCVIEKIPYERKHRKDTSERVAEPEDAG